jgi:hypothetical protein
MKMRKNVVFLSEGALLYENEPQVSYINGRASYLFRYSVVRWLGGVPQHVAYNYLVLLAVSQSPRFNLSMLHVGKAFA